MSVLSLNLDYPDNPVRNLYELMSVESALAFVSGSEYRKELARRIARQIAADVDLQDLIDQGEAYTDDLVALLMAQLTPAILRDAALAARSHARDLGLSVLSASELDLVIQRKLEPFIAETLDTLGARVGELARAVTRMMDAGIGEEVIRRTIASEAGASALLAPVSSVMAATGAGLVNMVERSVLEESAALTLVDAVEAGEEEPLFEWETRADDRVCSDIFETSCEPRHGQVLTMDEWSAFGLPGEAPTICTLFAKGAASYCRCVLRSAASEGRSPTPIRITDAAEAGRARAEEEMPIAA